MPDYPTLKSVPRISVEELARRQRSGEQIVVVDVRKTEDYNVGHIPGAVHIPLREIPHRFAELTHDALLVFY